MIEFHVNTIPIGQPRHRVTTIGKHARMYLPTKHPVHQFKAAVRLAFAACRRSYKLTGPIEITVMAYFPRPKTKIWKTKPMPSYWHIGKPDADNVLKAVMDSLNGLAWRDDAQICRANVMKFVCGGLNEPGVEIIIKDLAPELTRHTGRTIDCTGVDELRGGE